MDALAALFERFRRDGDVDALGEVFDRTAPRLLAMALHLCGDPAAAEDALQQTFVRAMQHADAFDAARQLQPWLLGLLTNVVLNQRRRALRTAVEPLPDLASSEDGPATVAERGELVARLRQHVEALPDEQRQVLLLRLQHGLSAVEIAEVVGVAPGAVRMRISRGLATLRRLLPAGLAVWWFGAAPTRGLAAVRRAVMVSANAKVAAGAGALMIGGIAMKMKGALLLLLVMLVGLLLWSSPFASPLPIGDGGEQPAALAVHDAKAHESGSDATAAATDPVAATRWLATPATGRMRVRVGMAKYQRIDPFTAVAGGGMGAPPAIGLCVDVWSATKPWIADDPALHSGHTDARGEVLFSGLPVGEMSVRLGSGLGSTKTIAVPADGEALVEFCACYANDVAGRVVDDLGRPVAGAEVWLRGKDAEAGYPRGQLPADRWLRRAAVTDTEGGFHVCALSGEAVVAASAAGFAASRGQPTQAVDGAKVTLVLGRDPASVTGTVLAADGQPVADASVLVTPSGPEHVRDRDGTELMRRLPQCARSDAQGRFRIDGLAAGPVQILAGRRPWRSAECDVEPAPGRSIDLVLQLHAAIEIAGHVRDTDGAPVANASVRALRDRGSQIVVQTTQSGDDGSFVLRGVPPLPCLLVAEAEGRGRAEQDLPDPSRRGLACDLVLAERSAVRGRVARADGTALESWTVQATPLGGGDSRDASTDAEGRFVLHDLGAGPFSICACDPNVYPPHGVVRREPIEGGSTIDLVVPDTALVRAAMHGRICDEHGHPLEGVGLWLGIFERQGQTASDGTFRFEGLVAGCKDLTLWKQEFATKHLRVELGGGDDRDVGDIALPRAATLRATILRADGTPWVGRLPTPSLLDASGKKLDWDDGWQGQGHELSCTGLAPVACTAVVADDDLVCAPQSVALRAGEVSLITLRIAIGRTRQFAFASANGIPDRGDLLHVVVADADGRVVTESDVRARKGHSWTWSHTFAFGSHAVTARSMSGQRFHAEFTVREELDDPTRIDVPFAN